MIFELYIHPRMNDKDPLSGLLMDIRDAHYRHTQALILQGALIHSDTRNTHTEKRTDRDTQDGGNKSNDPKSSS